MIGQTVSHYRILSKLGEGGMGVVYKAEDTKLKRTVALKFLPPESTRDPDAKERFVHEAQAAASLNHPHICTIHEIDEHDGQSFIAMEFVEGESLKDRIQRGPLPVDEVLSIAVQIGEGLQAAHQRAIVHRDIKSANVMMAASGQVKVMDFGLAKLAGRTKVTKEGTTLGTVGYMSPEQAQGEDADHRSDIWSLGVVLYEMVTGLLPFRGEYEQGLVYQIINSAPAPLTSVRTGVPMELERIVNKCLEKKRDERYQTAADLIADFRRLQRTMGAGTQATQQSMPKAGGVRPARKARWWYWAAPWRAARRWRWAYWAVPLIAIAIVAAALLIKMPRRATVPEEKSIAVLPFDDMSPQHDQEYFCDGMTDELTKRLGNIKDLRVPARTSAFFFKGKTGDIQEIGSKLKVNTVLEGSVRKAGDELRITAQLINVADGYHLWSETYDRKLEDVFAIQDEISSAIVNALQLTLTPQEAQSLSEHPIDNVKAYECYMKANRQIWRYDEKSLDSAFVYLQAAIEIMGDNAFLYAGMASACLVYANIGMGQEEYLGRAEEYAKKTLVLDPDSPGALDVLGMLSYYKDYPENWHDAISYWKKALDLHPNDIGILSSLKGTYRVIGKSSEASALLDRITRLDPLNPRHESWGFIYLFSCQFGTALEKFRMFYQADSTSDFAKFTYASALAYNGNRDEALAVIDRMAAGSPQNVNIRFCLLLKHALLKDKDSALRVITPEMRRTCWRDLELSYWVAARLSLAGAEEEALDWLENALHRGFINYPFIQCDRFLDNIRREERFKKLMEWAKNEWEHFEVPE